MTAGEQRNQLLQQILDLTPPAPAPMDLTALRSVLTHRRQLMERIPVVPPHETSTTLDEEARRLTAEILQRDRQTAEQLRIIRARMQRLMQRAGAGQNAAPRLLSRHG